MNSSHHLVKPIVFRNLTLENNIFQAPLAGYSSWPFRLLTWTEGRPGLLATEMISARAVQLGAPKQDVYLERVPNEGPVQFQLWGCDPEAIGFAARVADEHGADCIDLNCGCPVRKVRAAGAGSKLMENPPLIGKLIQFMRKNTEKPISIKIRVGTAFNHFNAAEIVKIAESEGVDFITVHGRTAGESYGTPVRYTEIMKAVQATSIPVIGNGDVYDGASARKMFEETGCAGVMVGRACMGAPWVFARIKSELQNNAYTPPTLEEIGKLLLSHHDMLVSLRGEECAIRHARKLGAFYSKGISGAKEFRSGLNGLTSREQLIHLINKHFALMGKVM